MTGTGRQGSLGCGQACGERSDAEAVSGLSQETALEGTEVDPQGSRGPASRMGARRLFLKGQMSRMFSCNTWEEHEVPQQGTMASFSQGSEKPVECVKFKIMSRVCFRK